MAETAAQKKAREDAEAAASSQAPVEGTEQARNVLTDSMPQPPGVKERRARRVARKQRQGPFVKYVGGASDRVIRPPDWQSLGFKPADKEEGHKTFVWGIANDYMIEVSQFTDEQLDYLLIDDLQQGSGAHSFLEVDYDDNKQLVQVVYDDE